ncbi:MAG: inositol-3-phosphate synthase [Egibacteraceae bacterium]
MIVQQHSGDDGGQASRRVGVAVVGLGGAVATTVVAGVELLRLGLAGTEGLPLAGGPLAADLVDYGQLVFSGWDLCGDDLATAAEGHGVLEPAQLAAAGPWLARHVPWPAVGDTAFCRNVDGGHHAVARTHRERIARIQADIEGFAAEQALDSMVMVNLASTERAGQPGLPALASPGAFEAGLDASDPAIGPALLYAYAAVTAGVPYANFTPSLAADAPALIALSEQYGVPITGKDGKTGQTMLKTVLAPGLRSRALRVEGWFSSNLLGNRDGLALDDPGSLAAKVATKGSVLDDMLGYAVDDHIVVISYYRPRGDNKEAWDTVDLVGFLGQRMQLKLNFLCRDSILAAPLVLEIARLLDLAARRGERGPQAQLGLFFKQPMAADGRPVEHALHRQEESLRAWLAAGDRAQVVQ